MVVIDTILKHTIPQGHSLWAEPRQGATHPTSYVLEGGLRDHPGTTKEVPNMWVINGEEEEDDQVLCDAATTHVMLQPGHAIASSVATLNRSLLSSVKDAAANSLLRSQLGAQTLKKCDILGLFCIVLQRHYWA